MIRAIIDSDAFKNSAGQKFKRPLEFFLSALRLSGATVVQRRKSFSSICASSARFPLPGNNQMASQTLPDFGPPPAGCSSAGILACNSYRARLMVQNLT